MDIPRDMSFHPLVEPPQGIFHIGGHLPGFWPKKERCLYHHQVDPPVDTRVHPLPTNDLW